jgi:hypothetical protein
VAFAYVIGFFTLLMLLGWAPHAKHKLLRVMSLTDHADVVSASVERCAVSGSCGAHVLAHRA